VAAGALHSLFVKSDGTLWAMGANGGQLGDGTTIYRSAPVQVATGVRTIAASYGHSLFITTNGTLWAMGSNGYGELGDGTTVTRLSPVQIAPSVQSIAAGGHHSLFVVSGDSGLAPPLITTQPTSQTMAAGHNAIFTVTASGNPAPSYQWQRLPAGSTAWENLNEGGSYRGTTSATLTVSSPAVAMSGDQFRCVINGSTGLVATNAVALTVTGAANALLQYPAGIAMDSSANLFVADASSNTICKITPAGLVSTLAGLAGVAGSQDGTGSRARFNQPNGLASDAAGNLYVADTGNATIRKITPAGAVSTLAGSATSRGSQDGTGSAASFSSPTGIAVDAVGNVYVADAMNATIRKITSAGIVSTLAGLATVRGDADGTGEAARFNYPNGLAVDAVGNLYVADTYNDTIRKVSPNGTVTTVAGSAGITGATDLTGSNALFNQPCGITLNATGNVWVADTGNGTIRRVTSGGVVTTLAGVAGIAGLADGAGSASLFNQPRSLVVDGSGNIYVADTGNAVIRRIALDNSVTTLALTATPAGSTNPPPAGGTTTPSPATGTGSASSGGGAMESWFVVMLILFGTARWSQVSSGRWHSWERGGC
jgi:sugar lactone lactonase YvrE